jgi:hypothetical protein
MTVASFLRFCKIKVVHICDTVYNTPLLGLDEHVNKPLAKPIIPRCLLILRFGVEDVIIAFQRRARPNMSGRITFVANVI